MNVCAVNQVLNDLGIIDDATLDAILQQICQPEPVSPEEFGNLTTQYMIAFLKTVLVGENGYKEMLTTDYALENEPFIEFFETEKGSPRAQRARIPPTAPKGTPVKTRRASDILP